MGTRVAITLTTLLLPSSPVAFCGGAAEKVPILYNTDLHHPHMDPDDHFDLATLFSIAEFDIRGIVLDCGAHQQKAPGRIPVRQMLHLTRRKVPYAIGLAEPLRSANDDGHDQPDQFQRAVALIIDTLRESPEKLTVFTTGSLRDVAVGLAFRGNANGLSAGVPEVNARGIEALGEDATLAPILGIALPDHHEAAVSSHPNRRISLLACRVHIHLKLTTVRVSVAVVKLPVHTLSAPVLILAVPDHHESPGGRHGHSPSHNAA